MDHALAGERINGAAGTPAARVLVALTDAEALRQIAGTLRLQGFEVAESSDGVDALVKVLANRFDAIVAGHDLAGIRGADLCQLLRRDPWARDTPFVLATNAAHTTSTRIAVDVVLETPIDGEALAGSLRQVIDAGVVKIRAAQQAPCSASRSCRRGQTMNPPLAPPRLICPRCDRQLSYLHSQLGGINERSTEQWDYFTCGNACGTYQYRHRTRRLRQVHDRVQPRPSDPSWAAEW